jgi:hypothetical protein
VLGPWSDEEEPGQPRPAEWCPGKNLRRLHEDPNSPSDEAMERVTAWVPENLQVCLSSCGLL